MLPIRHLGKGRQSAQKGDPPICEALARLLDESLTTDVILKVTHKGGRVLDEHLKELMQELGNAINESLSDSERIASAIGEIRRSGYDVFLVLEATIGFNKRNDVDDDRPDSELDADRSPETMFESTQNIRWTSQDHKFLRALKISVDDED